MTSEKRILNEGLIAVSSEPDVLAWRNNSDTRFCSFTAAVYTRQGEPQITGR